MIFELILPNLQPTLGVASSDSALLYTILSPVGGYFEGRNTSSAVSLLADPRYTRAWPGGVGDRKMGSNYAPTIHVQKEALSKGLQQVLWLYGEPHYLTEVGTMNIFVFFVNEDGGTNRHFLVFFSLASHSYFFSQFIDIERELLTPPLNGLILPGITRNSILSLVQQWGDFKVTEGSITMPEVCKMIKEERVCTFSH